MRVDGSYDQAFELSLVEIGRHGWYSRNCAHNPLLVEGKKTAALELARDLTRGFTDSSGLPDVVLVPALVLLVAGVSVTALAGHGFVLLVGAALLGAGYGTLISAGQAFAIGRVPRGQAGVAVASFFLVVDAGTGLGPALLETLAAVGGSRKLAIERLGISERTLRYKLKQYKEEGFFHE